MSVDRDPLEELLRPKGRERPKPGERFRFAEHLPGPRGGGGGTSTAPGLPVGWVAGGVVLGVGLALFVMRLLVPAVGVDAVAAPGPVEDRLPMAPAVTAASPAPVPSSTIGGDDAVAVADPAPAGMVAVHVAGAVQRPGVVRVPGDGRISDAVAAAGGVRADADLDRVNLALPLTDGSRVFIPIIGAEPPTEVLPTGSPAATAAGGVAPSAPGAAGAPVNINTADAAALDTLPGVGPATAEAIIKHRSSKGPFSSVEDLIEVSGIGEAKLERLRDAVTVGP